LRDHFAALQKLLAHPIVSLPTTAIGTTICKSRRHHRPVGRRQLVVFDDPTIAKHRGESRPERGDGVGVAGTDRGVRWMYSPPRSAREQIEMARGGQLPSRPGAPIPVAAARKASEMTPSMNPSAAPAGVAPAFSFITIPGHLEGWQFRSRATAVDASARPAAAPHPSDGEREIA